VPDAVTVGSLSPAELEAAHAAEPEDVVRSRPAMTAFRQGMRLHQARWREAHRYPIGTQPISPQPDARPVRLVGSRIPLDYARETGATFVTPAARAAVRARDARIEPHQSIDHQRTWADLLSSEALAYNLFGDLAADPALADRVVRAWWPDTPGRVSEVRFAHSPGRFDPDYLNSLRHFDAAFVLDLPDGTRGILAVDTKLHEKRKDEIPKPSNRRRYTEVAERSGVFAPGAIERFLGRSDRAVMWLEHLLLLSMLQHPSGSWGWGRYVVVRPAANPDIADLCERYQADLADDATFATQRLEDLLDSGVLPAATTSALRERYDLR
jgi:PD-(D/E)XK nuclease superfamily protein